MSAKSYQGKDYVESLQWQIKCNTRERMEYIAKAKNLDNLRVYIWSGIGFD